MKLLGLVWAAWAVGTANAATVINVPGANGGAGTVQAVTYPVAPGTLLNFVNPVLLNLASGEYLLTPTVAGLTPGATYGAWNFQSTVGGSWGNHFVAGVSTGGTQFQVLVDGVTKLEPTCKNHFCAWDTEAQAIDAWLATQAFSFHLSSPATVGFVSADYYLPDNLGGISFVLSSVTPPVPEPAPALMFAAGVAALAWRRRQRA